MGEKKYKSEIKVAGSDGSGIKREEKESMRNEVEGRQKCGAKKEEKTGNRMRKYRERKNRSG